MKNNWQGSYITQKLTLLSFLDVGGNPATTRAHTLPLSPALSLSLSLSRNRVTYPGQWKYKLSGADSSSKGFIHCRELGRL